MAWRLWIWKALLLAVAACELTGGENAPYDISYGFASDIDVKAGYQFNMAPINYSVSPLNFDALPGKIVVGAKGGKLFLLGEDLTLVQQLNMPCGSDTSNQVCSNNLVRLYSAPSDNPDTLVVCGSAEPQCSLVNVSSGYLTLTSGYVPSSFTLLTSDPNTPSVGIFSNVTTSRKTNFFAASGTSLTFHTFNVSDPSSLSTSLKFGITSINTVFNLTTWFSSLLVIVDVYNADYPVRGFIPQGLPDNRNPDEHKYLFVFVREQDPMTSMVTNKLVRLCQNDPGSVSAPNGLPFPTTLLKANISCQSASGPFKQNLLQGVVFSRPGRYYSNGVWVELMYGAFTDYTGYSPQTSICVYRANDSDYFLSTGANNRGVFDIFRSQVYDPVGGRNIANSYVECNSNGRTDLESQRINLVQPIQQYNPDPLAILSNVVVTKMVVDQPSLINGSSLFKLDVLFLGTSLGSVMKLAMTTDPNGILVPFVSENIQLGDASSVRQMIIKNQNGVKYLYVNTDNGIYKLPLERCSRYLDCIGCVASRDPYCAWNTVTGKCISELASYNTSILRQNINTGVADNCTGSYATSAPTASVPTLITLITPSIGAIIQQSQASQGALYLAASLGVTLLIIVVLTIILVAFCLFVYCGKTYKEGKEVDRNLINGNTANTRPPFISSQAIELKAHMLNSSPVLLQQEVVPQDDTEDHHYHRCMSSFRGHFNQDKSQFSLGEAAIARNVDEEEEGDGGLKEHPASTQQNSKDEDIVTKTQDSTKESNSQVPPSPMYAMADSGDCMADGDILCMDNNAYQRHSFHSTREPEYLVIIN